MQVLGVDRVLIATPEMDAAVERFEERLGITFGERIDPPDDPVANRMSAAGLEFVTTDDAESPVGRFLAENGPGVYALAVRVADLDDARDHLADRGVDPVAETAMGEYRELFYHPSAFEGVMLVLVEYAGRHPAEIAATDAGGG